MARVTLFPKTKLIYWVEVTEKSHSNFSDIYILIRYLFYYYLLFII